MSSSVPPPPSSFGPKMTETVTEEHVFKNGTWRSVVKVVRELPQPMKWGLVGYGVCFVGTYAAAQYREGQRALLQERANHPCDRTIDENARRHGEYSAVVRALRASSFNNWWDAAFWPFTVVSKVMPTVIMALNKPPPPPASASSSSSSTQL